MKRRTQTRHTRKRTRSLAYTAQSTTAPRFGFRSRRLSRRRFKSLLWNSTIAKNHYRSLSVFNQSTIAGPVAGFGVVVPYSMLRHAVPFFAAANVQSTDVGVTVPLSWNGDIIVRGGQFSATISIPSTSADVIRIKVWLVWANNNPNTATTIVPVLAQADAWDPSVNPDFKEFGRVTETRESLLNYINNSVDFVWRLPVLRIDQGIYNVGGHQPYLFVQASNQTSAAAVTVTVLRRYNLSFSADGV